MIYITHDNLYHTDIYKVEERLMQQQGNNNNKQQKQNRHQDMRTRSLIIIFCGFLYFTSN